MHFNRHTPKRFCAAPITFSALLLLHARASAQDASPSPPQTTAPTGDGSPMPALDPGSPEPPRNNRPSAEDERSKATPVSAPTAAGAVGREDAAPQRVDAPGRPNTSAEYSPPPPLAVAPAASAEATASDKGFALASAGNPPAFVLKLGATLQADGRVYFGDRQKDNILLRRVRPIVAGTAIGLVDYYLMPDFGTGQTLLFDAYLDAHPFPWLRLRVGKFKAPIGLERLQTDSDLPLPERALTSDLSPVRDVGAQLWGEVAGGILTYAIAVLDGSPDSGNIDQDTGGSKDLAARIFVQPFKQAKTLGNLGVGVAATTGTRNGSAKSTSLLPLRTIGQTTLFSYLAPATDAMGTETVFATGRESRLNPEVYYYYGPFGVLGEVIWASQEVHKAGSYATLTHQAWHATASYVIGGSNGFTGATPDYAWNPAERHYGALEIAARYSWLALDHAAFQTFADPAVSASKAHGFGTALTWALSRMIRFTTNFEHTRFEGGAGKKGAIANRKPESFMLTRAQLNF